MRHRSERITLPALLLANAWAASAAARQNNLALSSNLLKLARTVKQ